MRVVRALLLSFLAITGARAGEPLEPRLVKDLDTGTASGLRGDTRFATRGNTLYFNATGDIDGDTVKGLVRSDGSATGTKWLQRDAYDSGDVRQVDAFDGGVMFVSVDTAGVAAMYHADANFTQVRRIDGPAPHVLRGDGDDVVRTYECDGEAGVYDAVCAVRAGQSQAVTIASTPAPSPGAGVYEPIGAIGGAMLHFYRDALWRTDGTMAGTTRLADLRPWQYGVPATRRWPVQSLVANGLRYFQACTQASTASCGLYASDGSTAAPALLASVTNYVNLYAPFGDGVALVATDALWTSEGTPTTTRHVVTMPYYPFSLVGAGGLLHLIGWQVDPDTEYRYYVSDATEDGTREVPLPAGVRLDGLSLADIDDRMITAHGDQVLFPCSAPGAGQELCVAAGDGSGVTTVLDVRPGAPGSGAYPVARTPNATYFLVYDDVHGQELWRVAPRGDVLYADGFD